MKPRHLYADDSTPTTRLAVGIHDATERVHLVIHLTPARARELLAKLAGDAARFPTSITSFHVSGELEIGEAP